MKENCALSARLNRKKSYHPEKVNESENRGAFEYNAALNSA
jgi:hypothetical protein